MVTITTVRPGMMKKVPEFTQRLIPIVLNMMVDLEENPKWNLGDEEDLEDTNFDLIVSLSPEAQHRAIEMTRTMACEVEFWNTFDPTLVDGSRDAMLDAYRQVRDSILVKLKQRFPLSRGPSV